ncbi:superoxide dismutase family protein [Fulvivirga lutimaris]|uniref:superoxide dismutase family protein n=1 Tax=Fulvivirga lutimaris TaxID=1819566 RepID=UPI0012BBEFC3|nr:superoxide dismutase family protein [Fulvivirga lutimaris]MTI40440.1 superoxide dismutase family protein [Fulvivirga lutimaris]
MKYLSRLFVISGVAFLISCGGEKKEEATEETTTTPEEEVVEVAKSEAVAMISSASGSTLSGEATFVDNGDGSVTFNLNVTGAAPGEHALHLHQNGDCSADDATSAGGHWNPAETDHGKRMESPAFHAGDIDNMTVAEDSTGSLSMVVKGWSVGGADSTNVVGRAVIIHALADDFTSQPSGAAGPRVGCGVVTEKM